MDLFGSDQMNKNLFILLINIFLIGCSTTGEGYMQQTELLSQIEKGQSPVIIDVRSSYEYNAGHVPNAINIPFWTTFNTEKLKNYSQSELLVLYCEHGPRAGIAKLALSLSGFENISYLSGHMTGWKKSGLPITIPDLKKPSN